MKVTNANRHLNEVYLPVHNAEFSHCACENGCAFVPWIRAEIDDYLCEVYEHTVTNDNCVKFKTLTLQIPKEPQRYHHAKTSLVCINIWITQYPLSMAAEN